jgi:hypothetical protein
MMVMIWIFGDPPRIGHDSQVGFSAGKSQKHHQNANASEEHPQMRKLHGYTLW